MGSYEDDLLTTREAARLLGVGTTSVKRWADSGVLECVRTPGKHRRFARHLVEALRNGPAPENDQGPVPADGDPRVETWLAALLDDAPAQPAAALLVAERERRGAWWRVADSLAPVLDEIGMRWQRGEISIVDEHLASERLLRAVTASVDAIAPAADAPHALLLVAEGEQHTLGLALAELCLRGAGWSTRWTGRRTPIRELRRYLVGGDVALVAVSAAASFSDSAALRAQASELADACRAAGGVRLVLGGNGDWPEPPAYGDRVRSFAGLNRVARIGR